MRRRQTIAGRFAGAAAAAGILAAVASGLAGAAGSPPPASGNGIAPVYREGSSSLADCARATNESHVFGFKITKGSVGAYNGTYAQSSSGVDATHEPNNPLQVTISNAQVSGGAARFDWSANLPVDYVLVKAGSGGNMYSYASYGWGGHPASGPFGDTGLVSPKDSISHVLFCTIKKLRVEKTAAGSFTRTHHWSVSKQVTTGDTYGDSATLALADGQSGSAGWRIVTTKTGATDSGASVAGSIVVLNASPFSADVKLTESLADAVYGAGCPQFTLGKGAAKTCTYSAGVAGVAGGTNTVTARATNLGWMAVATASAPYAFGAPTVEVNKTVRWEDSNGESKSGLGATDATEYETTWKCGKDEGAHVNTVSLYGDGNAKLDQDSATLEVECAPRRDKLVVTKTADLKWERVNGWSVAKSATAPSLALQDGAAGSSTWVVDVTRSVLSNHYLVVGEIEVTNPNAYAVHGVELHESLEGAEIECESESGTIAAGGTLRCEYWAEADANEAGVNTVTVSTDEEGIDGEASDTWQALSAPNAGDVNAAVTVVDERLGQSWQATSSADGDRNLPEQFPCSNGQAVNTVAIKGDNPETGAVETGHLLAQASATVTTTCTTTPPPVTPPTTPPTTPQVTPPVVTPPVTPPVKPVAALTPPVAKAKPKPTAKPKVKTTKQAVARVCVAIDVSTKSVPAGKRARLVIRVTAGGNPAKGIALRLRGPGILEVVRSGAGGKAKTTLQAAKPGIVTVSALGRRGCNTARIGVVGAFEPPVTG